MFLALILSFSMVACGSSNAQNETENQPEITPEPVEERKYNYITGEELAFEELATMRPVAVMVDSSKYAMPQSGIGAADIIYEMVTEGGITRIMAVFSDIDEVEDVGPVRSARDQFVQFALPINAIYVHIGTSIYANDMLNFYHYQDIDGLYLGNSSFVFDAKRAEKYAHEHCWYTDDGMIEEGMRKTGISINGNLYPAFNFADYREAPVTLDNGLPATEVDFRFSDYADIDLDYNEEENRYYKQIFNTEQLDDSTDEQLSFHNVLLLHTEIGLYPDGLCTSFDLSQGEGFYFYGGKFIPVRWVKGQPEDPLQIFGLDGNPVKINVGKTYVAIIGSDMLETVEINDVDLFTVLNGDTLSDETGVGEEKADDDKKDKE
ncbi:MAG: DUF3048 domain-containing protein [Ruminococcaceae bacterium]|nr:DUF3048 domain-containing protein [Oscillospiraceae bacterium]